jgi:hypothetical protein
MITISIPSNGNNITTKSIKKKNKYDTETAYQWFTPATEHGNANHATADIMSRAGTSESCSHNQ